MRHALAILFACLLPLGHAAAEQRSFFGYGYTLEENEFRYIEHHQQVVDGAGNVTEWSVDFWDAEGKKIAEKHFHIGGNPAVPGYDFHMIRTGYREGLRSTGGESITLYRQEPDDGSESTESLKPRAKACADSGFDHFVRDHWETLLAGERVKFQFIAAGRLAAYNFKADRLGESSFEGKPTLEIKVALDSLFGVFVDPLIVEYDLDTRQLKRYKGIGNMQKADGKVYPVLVRYDSSVPKEAEQAVEAARTHQGT